MSIKRYLSLAVFSIISFVLLFSGFSQAADHSIILEVKNKTIDVNGKSAQIYTIEQPNGAWGYSGVKGQDFNVIVKNKTAVPTVLHWHGLILPNDQDGVPYITQLPIPPGGQYHYHYKLTQAGTYWMHSHMPFQTQSLMAAPFIIYDPHDSIRADQEVVLLFQDFSFKNPKMVLKSLQASPGMSEMANMSGHSKGQDNGEAPDMNDVQYEAFLTNHHTLQNPQIVTVKKNTLIRLRFINGSGNSHFWIDLGELKGTAIAFDGKRIQPLMGHTFQLATAQRIDILVKIPNLGGAFPILGKVAGTHQQTGLILATAGAKIPKVSDTLSDAVSFLNYQQELKMKAQHSLPDKPIDRIIPINLGGSMKNYVWTLNNQVWPKVTPIKIKQGERIEFIFNNTTQMAHPMHLHGHEFQLVGIDNKTIKDGPLHDTILVRPHSKVKIILDADHPGKWLLHCHLSYHQEAGMMTLIQIQPNAMKKETTHK